MLEIHRTQINTIPSHHRFSQLLTVLNRGLFEKEKVIRLSLLTSLAGESIFFLGPPGVAKSMVATRLKFAYKGARSFEFLMGKFSTPDEVFGPISISKLKNEDKYERLVDHYLPGSQIVFLDEIWKASPAIQNALLGVINEKIFRNGDQLVKVDLRGLIAASNELPQEGEGLEAIWDRFLVRLLVKGIEDEESFNKMITLPHQDIGEDVVPTELKINNEEYNRWAKDIDQVEVPMHILGLINQLKRSIVERNMTMEEAEHIYISDRRWRKIVRLLRTSAYFNGRSEVQLMDCFLIYDCIWNHAKQIEEVKAMVLGGISSYGYQKLLHLTSLRQEMEKLSNWIQKETKRVRKELVERIKRYKDRNDQAFAKIFQFWSNDQPAYIRMDDLKKLSTNQETFVPVFEQSNKVYRPFQTHPLTRDDSFTLRGKKKTYDLETEQVEKEIVEQKTPSDEVINQWTARINLLLKTCDEILLILEHRKKVDLEHGEQNLFVEHEHIKHIEQSLEASIQEMLQVRLDIEKMSHTYEITDET